MSQTSSQVREGHGFESSGLVDTAEEGGVQKRVGVSQRVVVGLHAGARIGGTNKEVLAFWSSTSFASASFNCLEIVTM